MPDKNASGTLSPLRQLYWRTRCPRRRHRARARVAALGHALACKGRRLLRREHRPILAIGLVEHVGDIVAAEPLVRRVRQERPDVHLVWVVRRRYRELVEGNPCVDSVLPVTCLTEWIHLAESRAFDAVVDLHLQGRCCETCWRQHVRTDGRTEVTLENYYEYGSLLQVFCRLAGIEPLDETPRVYIPPLCRASVDRLQLPRDYVVVHATSNQESRDWETANWRELAGRIRSELRFNTVEVGLRPVLRATAPGHVDLCGRLSLLETAEVIRRARLFIGIDSGPAHLANAVGTFGVVLLGQYRHWTRYMPFSGDYARGINSEILHADGSAKSLPAGRVFESVQRALARQSTGRLVSTG